MIDSNEDPFKMNGAGYEQITDSAEMFDSRPLFGVSTPRERFTNWTLAALSGVFLMVTFICSCAVPEADHVGRAVFNSICLFILGFSHLILIYWYRQGDLDPKFLRMVYFNAFVLNVLCLSAMLLIFEV